MVGTSPGGVSFCPSSRWFSVSFCSSATFSGDSTRASPSAPFGDVFSLSPTFSLDEGTLAVVICSFSSDRSSIDCKGSICFFSFFLLGFFSYTTHNQITTLYDDIYQEEWNVESKTTSATQKETHTCNTHWKLFFGCYKICCWFKTIKFLYFFRFLHENNAILCHHHTVHIGKVRI